MHVTERMRNPRVIFVVGEYSILHFYYILFNLVWGMMASLGTLSSARVRSSEGGKTSVCG